jgi:hypothetical protein
MPNQRIKEAFAQIDARICLVVPCHQLTLSVSFWRDLAWRDCKER